MEEKITLQELEDYQTHVSMLKTKLEDPEIKNKEEIFQAIIDMQEVLIYQIYIEKGGQVKNDNSKRK